MKRLTGKQLKELRLENNLSQQELADKAGVEQASISRWELQPDKPLTKSYSILFGYIFSKEFNITIKAIADSVQLLNIKHNRTK